MTPAFWLVLVVALLLVTSTLLLREVHHSARVEERADRRLEVIGALRAQVRGLEQRLADRADQRRPIGPVRMTHPPRPADVDATQVMKRGAA